MLKHLILAEGARTDRVGQLGTPKGHQLAMDRYFPSSSISILEGPHCLSPPQVGWMLNQLLVCLCSNGEENSENNNLEQISCVGCQSCLQDKRNEPCLQSSILASTLHN